MHTSNSNAGRTTGQEILSAIEPTVRLPTASPARRQRPSQHLAGQIPAATPGPGTTVSMFADTDRAGYDGTPIAQNVDLSSGSATVAWTPPAGTTGTYWIYAVATRNGTTGRTYSTGPVRIGGPTNYQ